MEARAKIFGHPIHQMLIPLPFGLFTTAALLDVLAAVFRAPGLTVVSFWNLVIGVVTALVAAVFGLIDYTGIPSGTRAKKVGALHGIGNVIVVLLFAFAVLFRVDEPYFAVSVVALVLEIAALLIALITGWLGGELVDRLAIGVHPDAHPNAPPRQVARRLARRRAQVVLTERTESGDVIVRQTRRIDTPPYGTPTTT